MDAPDILRLAFHLFLLATLIVTGARFLRTFIDVLIEKFRRQKKGR